MGVPFFAVLVCKGEQPQKEAKMKAHCECIDQLSITFITRLPKEVFDKMVKDLGDTIDSSVTTVRGILESTIIVPRDFAKTWQAEYHHKMRYLYISHGEPEIG